MEKTVILLTEDEVTKINELQSSTLQSLARLGEIHIQKFELEKIYLSLNEETDQLTSRYNTLKENEQKLAQEFNVSSTCIRAVVMRKSWDWLA